MSLKIKDRLGYLYDRFRYYISMKKSKDYDDFYLSKTKEKVNWKTGEGIGGMAKEHGQWQLEFMKKQGLKKSHTLLDIGCGVLRGGRYFIDYLNKEN